MSVSVPERARSAAARHVQLVTLVGYTLVAVAISFPKIDGIGSHLPGVGGDPLLNLWILEWVEHAAPHGWGELWNAGIFHPAPHTLAYSDSMFPLAAAHWLVRSVVRSPVLASNLLYIAAWALSGWFTYLLALRLGARRAGAIVAGLVYQLAAVRMVHYAHFQLAVGFLVPAVLLLVWRLVRRRTLGAGLALGATLALLTMSSGYYGLMTIVAVTIVLGGFMLMDASRRELIAPVALAIGVGALLVAPVARQYVDLTDDPHFRREVVAQFAAHPGDFLAVSTDHYLLADVPPFRSFTAEASRTIENRLFPGVVAVAAGVVGALWVLSRRGSPDAKEERRFLALMAVAGIALLVLAFGNELEVAGRRVPLPFGLLHDHVPGFSGIRAPARLVAYPLLVLAVFAGLGVSAVAERVRSHGARVALIVGLAAFVVAESALSIRFTPAPDDPRATAVNEELARRSDDPVLELPAGDPSNWRYALVEAPRQLLATTDWRPRVGGYSGFMPPLYPEQVSVLDTFPSGESLAVLDDLGVRTVVLRLALPGSLPGDLQRALDRDGVARYSERTARRLLDAIPDERVAEIDRVGAAYVVELTPPVPR